MRRTLDSWFAREGIRGSRTVTVEDALLAGRFPQYAWYRLRYFLGRYLIVSLVYAVKFLLLISIFSDQFLTILRVQAASAIAISFLCGSQ
ncbi:MAG: hypothetical protein ACRDJP_11970 [Actinomycetota bacterium]